MESKIPAALFIRLLPTKLLCKFSAIFLQPIIYYFIINFKSFFPVMSEFYFLHNYSSKSVESLPQLCFLSSVYY